MDGAGEAAHGVRHQAGMAAHLRFAHVALKFGLWNKRGHRVDNHKVNRARAHKHVGNVQCLFAVVGLRDEQLVGVDAKALGVRHVEGVLCVHKGARAAHFLAFGNDVQGERGFTRRFRAKNFADTPTGYAAHAQGQIKADGTCGNDGNINMGVVGKLHHGALAVLAFDGGKCGSQGFGARVFLTHGWFFGHSSLLRVRISSSSLV